jgi:hypothetical protein
MDLTHSEFLLGEALILSFATIIVMAAVMLFFP